MIRNDIDIKKNFIQEYIKEFENFINNDRKFNSNTFKCNKNIIDTLFKYMFLTFDELIFDYITDIKIYKIANSLTFIFNEHNICNYIQIKMNKNAIIEFQFDLVYNTNTKFTLIDDKNNIVISELIIKYRIDKLNNYSYDETLTLKDVFYEKSINDFKSILISNINKINNNYNKDIIRLRKIKKLL